MDKHYIASLTVLLLLSLPAASVAERPAAQPADESVFIEDDVAGADMRPAAEQAAPQAPAPSTASRSETRTSGDVLDMSAAGQPAEARAQPVRQLDFPRRGMGQDKVQNELGRPLEIIPPVGQPPISRWVYNDRVVYFEYSSVVHVVAK